MRCPRTISISLRVLSKRQKRIAKKIQQRKEKAKLSMEGKSRNSKAFGVSRRLPWQHHPQHMQFFQLSLLFFNNPRWEVVVIEILYIEMLTRKKCDYFKTFEIMKFCDFSFSFPFVLSICQR